MMKKGNKIILIGLLILISLGTVREISAVSIGAQFGEIIMENLRLGETYNTREMVNLPLLLTNRGDQKITIFLTVLKPQGAQLRKGYEPIPDTNWIELSTDRMEVEPGAQGAADVIIHVPSDEQYAKRRYQVLIECVGKGEGNIAGGVCHGLFFSIAPSQAQVKGDERKIKLLANLNYTVLPPKYMLYDFKLGKKQDLAELTEKTFKIINPNDEDYRYRLSSIAIKDSKVTSSLGYEDCPDPSFITFSELELDVPANTVKVVKVFLNIPAKKEYKGKSYMFIIRTELLGQEISVDQYNRVYVTTEK